MIRPGFPDTPGSWLACYRGCLSGDGPLVTPEQLGEMIGVSGATIRRWEAGNALPHLDDIYCFAEACKLTRLETEFLTLAFGPRRREEPPEQGVFAAYAREALDVPHPALLMDSLFFVRAYNNYNAVLAEPPHLAPAPMNFIKRMIELRPTNPEATLLPWLHLFWFNTAELCGLPGYRAVLQQLRRDETFERIWRLIASDFDYAAKDPLNGPQEAASRHIGTFRRHACKVTLPPGYFLQELLPADRLAARRLKEFASEHPKRQIIIDDKSHWAEEVWANEAD